MVNKPPAPAPVKALPRIKTVALGARPAISCPVPKTTVATMKMEVGWKMVESRPTSGVVQELAIYSDLQESTISDEITHLAESYHLCLPYS